MDPNVRRLVDRLVLMAKLDKNPEEWLRKYSNTMSALLDPLAYQHASDSQKDMARKQIKSDEIFAYALKELRNPDAE